MKRHVIVRTLLLALIAAGVAGCGDSGSKLYLQPFATSPITLQVNQEFNIVVSLSGSPGNVTYVDIQNPVPDQLTLTPPQTVKYEAGDSQDKQVKVYPAQKTNGQVQLVFTLRDTEFSQTFLITVE